MGATTPVIRDIKSVFNEPLPDGPLVIHFTAEQWTKMGAGLVMSKRRIGATAKGLFVVPDPFGGFMGIFACAAQSGEGLACIPEIVRDRGRLTFGPGCRCIRGKDLVERPTVEEVTCALAFTPSGKLTCIGSCGSGRKCQLVKKPRAGGVSFVTCECS